MAQKNIQHRCLIFGAGNAGKLLLERIADRCNHSNIKFGHFNPIGFIDDNKDLLGKRIVARTGKEEISIPVIGTSSDALDIIDSNKIDVVLVTMNKPNKSNLDKVKDACKKTKIECEQLQLKMDYLDETRNN